MSIVHEKEEMLGSEKRRYNLVSILGCPASSEHFLISKKRYK